MKPSRELLLKVIGKYWPMAQDAAPAELDRVNQDNLSGQSVARIQLAVLKLAQGHRNKLGTYIKVANEDPRDVIAYAEYPAQTRAQHLAHFRTSDEEKQELKAI